MKADDQKEGKVCALKWIQAAFVIISWGRLKRIANKYNNHEKQGHMPCPTYFIFAKKITEGNFPGDEFCKLFI